MIHENNLNSIIVDLKEKTTDVKQTCEIGLPVKFNLSVLRGQVVFTSAYVLINKYGQYLFQIDKHFNRLEKSYKVMFESRSLPFTRKEFQSYCDLLIEKNKATNKGNYYQVLILLLAGSSDLIGLNHNKYGNGFGSNLAQVLFLANPMSTKPDWTFEKGINAMTFTYQREIAEAKPTLYLGGIKGNHILSAINTFYLIHYLSGEKISIEETLNKYKRYSKKEQISFRMLMHDLKNQCLKSDEDLKLLYPDLDKETYSLTQKISKNTHFIQDYKRIENKEVHNLMHEVVFISPKKPHLVLEGSTFSLMGIDKNNQVRFIPLENKQDNSNKGTVLESTTTTLLKEMTIESGYSYIETPINYDEVLTFNCLFALSATRIFSNDGINCPPINSIDGKGLAKKQKKSEEIITHIFEKMRLYFESYRY